MTGGSGRERPFIALADAGSAERRLDRSSTRALIRASSSNVFLCLAITVPRYTVAKSVLACAANENVSNSLLESLVSVLST